jgi:outer membrane murein-binding lipoprotein Lpp
MNIKQRIMNSKHQMMNHKLQNSIFCLLSSLFCLYFVTGCESSRTTKNPLAEQVQTLTRDKREMMHQIEQLESKSKSLQKQINNQDYKTHQSL